jgi:hypothetical protein
MRKRWMMTVLMIACSDSKLGDERFIAKLRDCDLLSSDGKFDPHFTRADRCALQCTLAASCGELTQLMCEPDDIGGSLLRCLAKCEADKRGTELFVCTDGSHELTERCDGLDECDDGSDEADCPLNAFFICDDGDRIVKSAACDGLADCDDRSDEDDCSTDVGFRCADGDRAYANDAECDGRQDCEDGSDELRCLERGLSFKCDDGALVPRGDVCDGFASCEDGSDEEQGCAILQCDR